MSKVLFTPGPTNVPDFIREVLGRDLIHHRMADYHELLKEINEDLKVVFGTSNDVLVLTSSGTGSMESTVVNLFHKVIPYWLLIRDGLGKDLLKSARFMG